MSNSDPDLKSIFGHALEIDSFDERAAYVAQACGDNSALRAEIEGLLRALDQAGEFMQSPAAAQYNIPADAMTDKTADYAPIKENTGTVIGPYKLLEQIGEGGMGVVYMADQQSPVRRRVALKIIKPGMDTRQVIARFEAERQALALMDHPNIARVLDAGATDSGRPYFVMELVRGISITDYCDQNNLPVHERLDLFVHVCHAVQHAHQKGIIHRDLKPSNVLVTLHDGRPVPKVIDFGVAKATNQQLTEKTLFTNFAQMVGTPLYMSPEQAEMTSLDIDTRSDIYSLGVLLYELLTGTTPFDKKRMREAAYDEIRRIIREEEPQKPSTRLSSLGATRTAIAAHRHADPNRLSQLLRGDLDWIVMKSLEKDRTRRYETANGLARDVQRYLTDQPVEACPPSAGYRFRKFARRNRVALMTGVLISSLLILGTVVSTWQAIRATRAERVADMAREDEAEQRIVAEEERIEAEKQRTLAEAQRNDANEQRRQAEANLQKARKAVDEYFTLVSESTLLDVPGLQPLRKELLEAALRFYEGFATERKNDPAALADLAVTYMRVAEICHVTDRNDDAIAAIDKALDTIDRLRREFPNDRAHHRKLAGFWKGHRRAQSGTEMPKNPQAALASLVRLIDTMQILATENPDELRFRSDIAALCFRTGDLLISFHQADAGVKYFERSQVILEELVRDRPNVPEHRADLARVYQYLGSSLPIVGYGLDGEAASHKALSLREQLVAELPNVPQHRADLVFSLAKCGGILIQREPAQAEMLLRRARELAKSLVREYPENVVYREQLMAATAGWVAFAVSSGKQDTLKEAIGELEALVAERPKDPQVRYDFANKIAEIAEQIRSQPDSSGQREELHRRSLAISSELVNEFPRESRYVEKTGHSYRYLGWITLDAGRPNEALENFDKAAEVFKKLAEVARNGGYYDDFQADTLLQQVGIHAAAKRNDDAEKTARQVVEMYDSLVRDYPNNAEYRNKAAYVRSKLGELLARQGQWDETLDLYLQALAAEPNSGDWFGRLLGLVHGRAGSSDQQALIDKAERALVNGPLYVDWCAVRGRWTEAAAGFEKRIESNPENHWSWYQAAFVFAQQGDTDGYRRHCERMLARFGDTQDPGIAERIAKACMILPAPADQVTKARELSERAVMNGSNQLTIRYFQLAHALADYRAGEYAIAQKSIDKCLHSDKVMTAYGIVMAQLLDAMIQARLGNEEKAHDAWSQALQYCAGLPQLEFGQLLFSGDWHDGIGVELLRREAEQLFKGTSGADATIASARAATFNNRAWQLAASPEEICRNPTLALDLALKAVSLVPNQALYRNTLGVAQYRAGKWEDAITSLTKADETAPEKYLAFNGFFLAMAHWQLQHKDEARKLYDQSVEWMTKSQPTNVELVRFRAEANELLGVSKGTPKKDEAQPAAVSP